MSDLYTSWDLGGMDCELCGYSWDHITVERADGEWYVQTSFGCYGGDGTSGKAEVIQFLIDTAENDIDSYCGYSRTDFYELAGAVFLEDETAFESGG